MMPKTPRKPWTPTRPSRHKVCLTEMEKQIHLKPNEIELQPDHTHEEKLLGLSRKPRQKTGQKRNCQS